MVSTPLIARLQACARLQQWAWATLRRVCSQHWFLACQCSSQLGRRTIRTHCTLDISMARQVSKRCSLFEVILMQRRGADPSLFLHDDFRLLRATDLDTTHHRFHRSARRIRQYHSCRYMDPNHPHGILHSSPARVCLQCSQSSPCQKSSTGACVP